MRHSIFIPIHFAECTPSIVERPIVLRASMATWLFQFNKCWHHMPSKCVYCCFDTRHRLTVVKTKLQHLLSFRCTSSGGVLDSASLTFFRSEYVSSCRSVKK